MSELTDATVGEWLELLERRPPTISLTCALNDMRTALKELQRHRAAVAADEERVRAVVREAAGVLLIERKLYVVRPQHPTMGEIALEAYGHGRACDAVALLGDELATLLDAIATRAAKQLATSAVRLSSDDIVTLTAIRDDIREFGLLGNPSTDRDPVTNETADEAMRLRGLALLDRLRSAPQVTITALDRGNGPETVLQSFVSPEYAMRLESIAVVLTRGDRAVLQGLRDGLGRISLRTPESRAELALLDRLIETKTNI